MKYEISVYYIDRNGILPFPCYIGGAIRVLSRNTIRERDFLEPQNGEYSDEIEKSLLTGTVKYIFTKDEVGRELLEGAEAIAVLEEKPIDAIAQKYNTTPEDIRDKYIWKGSKPQATITGGFDYDRWSRE